MLQYHHTGILVKNIANSVKIYSSIFPGKISENYYISTQRVNVCFIEVGNNSYLELVEEAGPESVVSALLKKKIKYYHVGYLTENIEKTIGTLSDNNFKHLVTFNSEAFEGRPCAFLYSPELHLIELIEKSRK